MHASLLKHAHTVSFFIELGDISWAEVVVVLLGQITSGIDQNAHAVNRSMASGAVKRSISVFVREVHVSSFAFDELLEFVRIKRVDGVVQREEVRVVLAFGSRDSFGH